MEEKTKGKMSPENRIKRTLSQENTMAFLIKSRGR
jgi:hypothetical protein